MWFAWSCLLLGTGLLSTVTADTNRAAPLAYSFIAGVGLGVLMPSTFYPVLAPIPVSLNASALSFFMFVRLFAQVWGVTIGGAILQNELSSKLPAAFLSQFPAGTAIAYSIIPEIAGLQEPLRHEVAVAFADSLKVFWQVLIGVSALGFISSLFMKALPLQTATDKEWGFRENAAAGTELENGASSEAR